MDNIILQARPIVETRIETFSEIGKWLRFLLVDELDDYDTNLLYPKHYNEEQRNIIKNILINTKNYIQQNGLKGLEEYLRNTAKNSQNKAGNYFWPLRVAISGSTVSLPLFESMKILGKEKVLKRLEVAISKIEEK